MKSNIISVLFLVFGLIIFFLSFSTAETRGRLKRTLPPYEYGTIVMNQFSEKKGLEPVIFRHWSHRNRYTCRLCHIDLGFAMVRGGTPVQEEDNRNGQYCGACHNGKEAFSVKDRGNCKRCHSPYPVGLDQEAKRLFYKVTKTLPRGRFGNGVDWTKAEEMGKIKLIDTLDWYSFKRPKMKRDKGEIEMVPKVKGLPDIIFSHKKHAAWNGCEICHPDIFAMKKGGTKFKMTDNFNGLYCGACHGKVAFPLKDCGLCHAKPVSL